MNLPEGWKITTLGEVSEFINGDRGKNYPNQKDFITTGIPFINAGHIQNGNINFDSMNYISDQKFNCLGSGKVQHNDILYCLRGSLGKNAIVNDIKKGAIASSLVIIRPHKNISTKYLYYFLNSPLGKTEIYKYDNGSSQPNLSAKSVKSYKIPLPPIASQRTIANILDKADEIIRKRKEAIALTEQLLKSTFLDMFGDPVINPKGWEVVQLSKIADFENGDRSSNYPSGKDIIENGILFLNTKNIVNNQLNLGIKQYISEEKFNSLTRGKLKKGDLLITLRGTLGNCCIFDSEYRTGFINAQMMIIRVKPNISNKFIHALLTSKQLNNFLQMIGNGAAIPQLTAKQIKELGVYNPPIELQNKFSDFIEKITKLKEKHYQNLQESENLFNSLLQKAFKGEL